MLNKQRALEQASYGDTAKKDIAVRNPYYMKHNKQKNLKRTFEQGNCGGTYHKERCSYKESILYGTAALRN